MYQAQIARGKQRGARHREMIELEDGQEYGYVERLLGNGRVDVLCGDGNTRMGRICGAMRRFSSRCLVEKGDIVAISHRGFEDKVDIFHKFTQEQSHKLLTNGELPQKIAQKFDTNSNMEEMEGCDIENIDAI